MKKIFNILFTISLLFIIVATTVRFNIVEPVLDNLISNKLSSHFVTEVKRNLNGFDADLTNLLIEKTLDKEKINVISKNIRKSVLRDLINDEVNGFDMSSEINYLISDIENPYKSIIKMFINKVDFNQIYKDMFKAEKNKVRSEIIIALKIYDACTNDSMISFVAVLIVLSLVIIIIINKSINNTLNEVGMSLFINGIIMIVILFFLKRIEVLISMLPDVKIDINLFIYLTFLFIILGFILKELKLKKMS